MNERYSHVLCIAIVGLGLAAVAFLYSTEPRSFAEVATKSQVVLGTYAIDKMQFEKGVADFRAERFADARAAFALADPEGRDAATQFFIAYSYYRQGWGRVSNDDAVFNAGLEVTNRVIVLDPNFRSSDDSLQIKTANELKAEFEEGLKVTADDFNPLKLTRERK